MSDTPRTQSALQKGMRAMLVESEQLERELAAMTKERDEKHRLLCFVERWATHHGSKPHMTASQTLDVIRHHPDIEEITKSYSDGVIPPTPNLWEENNFLRARVAELENQKEVACVHEWYLGRCVHCDRPVKEIKK